VSQAKASRRAAAHRRAHLRHSDVRDNTQNDGNHIHSVWRDFDGDFGRDILREHLKSVAH
jgi:hypothetical protein